MSSSTDLPKQSLTEGELIFIQRELCDRCRAFAELEKSDALTNNDHRLWLLAIREYNEIQKELDNLRQEAKTTQEWVLVEQGKEDDWVVVNQQNQQNRQ